MKQVKGTRVCCQRKNIPAVKSKDATAVAYFSRGTSLDVLRSLGRYSSPQNGEMEAKYWDEGGMVGNCEGVQQKIVVWWLAAQQLVALMECGDIEETV